MIIELICSPLILIGKGLISLIPFMSLGINSIVSVLSLLLTALNFFPIEMWIMCIGSIVFWITINVTFGIVKFVVSLFTLGVFGNV